MRRSFGLLAVGVVASLVVTVSVAQTPAVAPSVAAPTGGALAQAAVDAAAEAATAARRALVVAKYKGGQITVGDLEDAAMRQGPHAASRYTDPAALKDLYDRTLRLDLLAQEAERRGVDKRPDVVEAIKQNAVQTLYRRDFDEKITPASMSAEAVQQFFTDNAAEFNRPAMRRASHIVVATREEAVALLDKAKKADVGEFRRLARELSIDNTNKARGGDLRYFDAAGVVRGEPGAKVPEAVIKAVFALKTVGDVAAQPVAIDGGFSVVKYTGERPAETRTLADAEESIRARLWRQKRQEAMDAFVAELRTRLAPEIHPELVDAISFNDVSPTAGIAPGFPNGNPYRAAPSEPGAAAPEQH